jgi:hypothetical protein
MGGGLQSQSGRGGEDKNSVLYPFRESNPSRSARSLISLVNVTCKNTLNGILILETCYHYAIISYVKEKGKVVPVLF